MNFREAWSYNLTIHHRNGMTLVRRPENPLLADIHLRMGLEVCLDNEAQTVLPEIAAVLEIPPQELYIEQDFLGILSIAFYRLLPNCSASKAARLAAFFRIPIDDGWLPGPAPLPTGHQGTYWHTAYEALRGEQDHAYWELRQMAYNSRMKICQQPANQIGGQTVWGVRIENWKSPNLDLGWWSLSNTETIDVALTQAGIPLVGWYTGRGAEQQHQFEVMQRAKII